MPTIAILYIYSTIEIKILDIMKIKYYNKYNNKRLILKEIIRIIIRIIEFSTRNGNLIVDINCAYVIINCKIDQEE